MNNRKPTLAVLIPFYGPLDDLRNSLQSLAQEIQPHDVVIVDDGNPTPISIPRDWHARVTVVRHERNRGITAALNTGLEYILRAGYSYVARMDAGDLSIRGRLDKQVAFLERSPECMLLGSYALFVAEDGRSLFTFKPPSLSREIYRALHRKNCFCHPTVMFRADVFAEVGQYRDIYPAAEDYDLFFRIAQRFSTAIIPEVLLEYKVGAASISSRRRRAQVKSRLRIVLAHFDPLLRQSYIGMIEGMISMILPRSATTRLHELRGLLGTSGVR
jgi:glycosyltransferase involved in cell wall biosynthesis